MEYYKIDYREYFSNNGVYLYERETDEVSEALKDFNNLSLRDKPSILVCDFSFSEDFTHNCGYVYTKITPKLISFIFQHRETFRDLSCFELYIDAELTEIPEDSSEIIAEYLMEISNEDWIKTFFKLSEESSPVSEETQQLLDQIDFFMSKGRKSLRAAQRGDKYLQGENLNEKMVLG